MKITICGSIAFYDDMLKAKDELEEKGHEVKLPPTEVKDDNGNLIPIKKYYELRKKAKESDKWIWDRKEEAMMWHFEKVNWSDAILVLNYEKNGIKGYVGANTLLEMGLALWLKKKIYLLNEIPEMGYTEEIRGMKPVVLNGTVSNL
ncbi:MAG TPA: hypothetical protein VJC07_04955 [Candidatus Nanoarchaeia archaeon]|nr:hypothetical protein [Candidatus Nanoarchaeia archaeon]